MDGFVAADTFNEDGTFTDAGKGSLVTFAGDDHKETKAFDDIKDLGGLAKVYADTKSALGKKLENVIQKPADDADETVKANYRAELAKAAGAPDDKSGYELYKPESLPEGMEWSEDLEAGYRELFAQLKVPKDTALALSKHFADSAIANYTTIMDEDKKAASERNDAAQREFDEGCAKLRTEQPGDKLALFTRTSLKAIEKYGSKELTDKLKEAKMYENATDLTKWRDTGVSLATLRLFANVGNDMNDAGLLGRRNVPNAAENDKLAKMYSNTPE